MSLSATEESRQGELDRWLDNQPLDPATPGELFALVDAIDSQSALKRAFTDPAASTQAKQELAVRLFEGKLGGQALEVLKQAVALRWRSGAALVSAVERQAVRGEFTLAQNSGQLDAVIDELVSFGQIVRSDDSLRSALADQSRPVAARRQLVADLLAQKSTGWTASLAGRAAMGKERNFEVTLAHYLDLAAALRGRQVARVTVARPMEADQVERLRRALSRMSGRDVDLQFQIDPKVIGGVRVEMGDQVIQGTISERLEQVKRQLG